MSKIKWVAERKEISIENGFSHEVIVDENLYFYLVATQGEGEVVIKKGKNEGAVCKITGKEPRRPLKLSKKDGDFFTIFSEKDGLKFVLIKVEKKVK